MGSNLMFDLYLFDEIGGLAKVRLKKNCSFKQFLSWSRRVFIMNESKTLKNLGKIDQDSLADLLAGTLMQDFNVEAVIACRISSNLIVLQDDDSPQWLAALIARLARDCLEQQNYDGLNQMLKCALSHLSVSPIAWHICY